MKKAVHPTITNNKGFASIEATVLIVLFVSMLYYMFGFFGVVHTGILHNIHARTYAFETFRHRSNLMYFRENKDPKQHYYNMMTRLHGVNTDAEVATEQKATERPITMGVALEQQGRRPQTHSQPVPDGQRNTSVAVNPVWIMAIYGICLNAQCGGS